MKYGKKYMFVACAALLLGMQSCDLEEYNPAGSTPDNVYKEQAGFEALVNSAYAFWGGQFYGREDFVLLLNGGGDLWINIANCGYGRQMSKYEELTASVGQIKNTWNRLYEIINDCNAGLERIDQVEFKDKKLRDIRFGELSFMRAYAYWHLVEIYGNVDLRTKETSAESLSMNCYRSRIDQVEFKDKKLRDIRFGELSFMRAYAYWHLVEIYGNVDLRTKETSAESLSMNCYRSSYEDLYDLMLTDAQNAVDNLPVDPYPVKDVGRATSKAAYGLLARIALTRVSYCDSQADKDKYYKIAEDAAQYVIDNQSALKVSLYNTPAEVFDPDNNKTNKEAMFVVTHSTESSLNMQAKNPNRMHMYFHASYSARAGMVQDYEYGNDKNAKSGSMAMMPTRYLLELYNEDIDARYNAWFREEYKLNTPQAYAWTKDQLDYFEKPSSMIGQVIQPGETALLFTKKKIAGKRNLPYAVVDIDDTYAADGSVSKSANFNIHFPTLLKYEDANFENKGLPTNSQVGANDVITMRLPEMYFIVAECEIMKSGGNKEIAKARINDIRKRAAVPGKEAEMEVGVDKMTIDFILEERAREYCGEFMRWFDLKRTGKLVEYVKAHNPDIPLIQPHHAWRPIPQMFLDSILNPDEFGQNEGYN